MSADNAQAAAASSKENAQSVQLFQRAHQKMVMLQRVEDQMQQLLNQRRSIQDELRGIQVQINEEFDKLLRANAAAAAAAAAGSNGASSPGASARPFVDIGEGAGRRQPEAVIAGE
jgi:hypothetical protein